MSDFASKYERWDAFLDAWPRERLHAMTLDDYAKAGSKDSFTHWIESRLDQLGSIWGSSAFKFGVYSRTEEKVKDSGPKLSYSATHAWHTSLGATAEAAFGQVRQWIEEIAGLAAKGDLAGIQRHEGLGEAYKWKIAFHYQDRNAPVIVNIFTRPPLELFVGADAGGKDMDLLQAAASAVRPPELGVLEFGERIWSDWSVKNLRIWKLSHGDREFSEQERSGYLRDCIAVVHEDTGFDQGKRFAQAPVGTLFHLCHGNSPQLVGQFVSPAIPCAKGPGWLQRSYRLLKKAVRNDGYHLNQKKWTPRGVSTFWQVGPHDLPLFERSFLAPYFSLSLGELAGMVGEPIDAATDTRDDPAVSSDEGLLRRFDGRPAFKTSRAGWPAPQTALFCRLARAVHGAGLDWWHVGTGNGVAFGRKNPGSDRAVGVFATVSGSRAQNIRWNRIVPGVTQGWQRLTEETAAQIEAYLLSAPDGLEVFFPLEAERPGLWPDQLRDQPLDEIEPGDEETEGMAAAVPRREPINRIYYGPPGTGKTRQLAKLIAKDYTPAADDGPGAEKRPARYCLVTFHQSYSYEEFVEGLRPVLVSEDRAADAGDDVAGAEAVPQDGQVRYRIRNGVFKDLCRRARKEPGRQFAMIIDEINRGNVSKIFGELITLIEADKREGADQPLAVTLPYSGERFSVPPNVDIIGTMNTADRSLAALDTALRRRFEFVPLLPDVRDIEGAPLHGLRVRAGEHDIVIPSLLEAINARIEALYDRDHCIGHSYFLPLLDVANAEERFVALGQVFRNRILPLLEEYFFENWENIGLVLADNQKREEARFVLKREAHDDQLRRLFGADHGLDGFATRHRFEIQEKAFSEPEAYLGIYRTFSS